MAASLRHWPLAAALAAGVLLVAACGEQSTPARSAAYPTSSGASSILAGTGPSQDSASPGSVPARAGGIAPAHGGAIPRADPAIASLLSDALLARFRGVRRVTPGGMPAPTVVLAPLPQNAALAREYGAADFPVRDGRCRPWVAGLWSNAVHTPGLEGSAAAIASFYGAYMAPRPHSTSLADATLMEALEVIVAAPTAALSARLVPGQVPARCRRPQLWARQATGLTFGWVPGQVRQLPAPDVGQDSGAYSLYGAAGIPILRTTWITTFRVSRYVVQVIASMWPGIRNPAVVLDQLASAAYAQTREALARTSRA